MTDSMDGCNVLPETQFVGTRLRVDTTRVLAVGGFLPPWGAAGERSEFNIKPPLGAPLLIFPRGYLLKSFPRVDTSARQLGFEIRVFPTLGELPKAIKPHLPVCQLYRWQLGPNMWSSPTTKSLDPIVVTALRVGFSGESHRPDTCGFACNCPEPEAWTTEASGLCAYYTQSDYTNLLLTCHLHFQTHTLFIRLPINILPVKSLDMIMADKLDGVISSATEMRFTEWASTAQSWWSGINGFTVVNSGLANHHHKHYAS